MMAVGAVGLEARGIARLEHGLAAVLGQDDFALQHVDELVFLLVPMPQRRRRTRLERGEIDAELVETCGVAETLALATLYDAIERRRISRACVDGKTGDIDLRHGLDPLDDRGSAHADADAERDQRRRQAAAFEFIDR